MSQPTEYLISADDEGNLVFIFNDELAFLLDLGPATTQRVSEVEPTEANLWTADMGRIQGPVLGPFALRGQALEAEIEYLKERVL